MRALAALVMLFTVACQAGAGGAPAGGSIPTEIGVGPRSTFAVATFAGLLGLGADGKVLGRIVTLPKGAVASSLTVDPSRTTLYFALTQTIAGLGFGADLYRVNVDGTDLRPVITRDLPNVFYASPSFEGSGKALFVHRRAAKEDADHPGVYLETVDTIERVDLASGQRRTVMRDAAEPAIAPNGATLVFVHIDRGQQDGLWRGSTDGTPAEPFLKTGDRFWFLQAPRISPNGEQVAWSSAGRSSQRRADPPPLVRLGGTGKLAHLDIASELYVAPIGGTSLRSIALTGDDVVPAWSPDGTRIAYIALATLYIVSAADGTVLLHQPALGFNYGDPVWLR